jgi:hypothetical protein
VVEKTKFLYVLPPLFECLFATITFSLQISMGAHDVFALVVNFINIDWQPKHVTIMLFKATKITDQTKVLKLQAFMDKHDL